MTAPSPEQIGKALCDLAEAQSATSYLAYLGHLIIDSKPKAPFRDVARPWQWDFARQIAPLLEHVAGIRKERPEKDSYWLTLPRGHDKTTSLGRACNWLLAFSRLRLVIKVAAADLEQASLLTEAMEREAAHNPWLSRKLKFQKKEVSGPFAKVEVMTSDAPSSAGARPDFIIMDEVTHWHSRDLWNMLVSSQDKRDAACVVITNAGFVGSWQDQQRKEVQGLRRWHFYESPGRLDTWMNDEKLAESAKLMTPSEAQRLLWNVWQDGSAENGYLSRAQVEACVQGHLSRKEKGERGIAEHVASIDYGPIRDRTCCCVSHQDMATGDVVLDVMDVFQGAPGSPVPVNRVREWVEWARGSFAGLRVVADPSGLEEMLQDYQAAGIFESLAVRASPASNHRMAECLRGLVVQKKLALYPDAGLLRLKDGGREDLVDELASLVTRPVGAVYRFDHKSGKHDDRSVCLGMACVNLLDRPKSPPWEHSPLDLPRYDVFSRPRPRSKFGLVA